MVRVSQERDTSKVIKKKGCHIITPTYRRNFLGWPYHTNFSSFNKTKRSSGGNKYGAKKNYCLDKNVYCSKKYLLISSGNYSIVWYVSVA